MTSWSPDVIPIEPVGNTRGGSCEECLSMKIAWGQVATIGLGVVAGLLAAGLLARVVR